MAPLLSTRTQGRVLVVEMARPQEGNALSRELQAELAGAWRQLEAGEELLVGVLHGSGGIFSVGHDLQELASGSGNQADPEPDDGLFPYSLSKPVIAAVEGQCFGLGFELALACDLRVAADDAEFGFPDTNLYVSYRLASALLPRITNLGASLDLLLTGNTMTASRLEQLRLVNRVAASGQALHSAIDLAQDMAEHFGSAMAFRKEQIWQFSGLPLPTALSLARSPYNSG